MGMSGTTERPIYCIEQQLNALGDMWVSLRDYARKKEAIGILPLARQNAIVNLIIVAYPKVMTSESLLFYTT